MNQRKRFLRLTSVFGLFSAAVLCAPRTAKANPSDDCSTDEGACRFDYNSYDPGSAPTTTNYAVGLEGQTKDGFALWGVESGYGTGVLGTSYYGIGVAGVAAESQSVINQPTIVAGVYGEGNNTGSHGVYGQSDTSTGIGVYGVGYSGVSAPAHPYGVYGTSGTYDGVHGEVNNSASAVAGNNAGTGYGAYFTAVEGEALYAKSTTGDGVRGISTSGNGIYGTSGSSTNSAVAGINTNGGQAIWGAISPQGAGSAIYGSNDTTTTGAYAGYFKGRTNTTGCVQYNGTNEFGCSSDRRLKQNIAPLTGALDTLLKLKGVTYEWKKPEDQGKHATGRQTGFIAQEVEEVIPNWVDENTDGFKTLTIQPNQVTALEVESIRTLKMENDMMRERLAALESGRQVMVSGINLNGVGFGVGGLAIAGGLVFSRRKRDEKKA
jgi:hypothetical protein